MLAIDNITVRIAGREILKGYLLHDDRVTKLSREEVIKSFEFQERQRPIRHQRREDGDIHP